MGKKNKDKHSKDGKDTKENKDKENVNTSGGIRKFFARISRKRNKDKKNTTDISTNKHEEKSPANTSDLNDPANKNVAVIPQIRRRRACSTERCKSDVARRSSFDIHLRNAQSDEDLNTVRYNDTKRRPKDSLLKGNEYNSCENSTPQPQNASINLAHRRNGSALCRPLLSTTSSPLRTFPRFTSLPSSPTHCENKWPNAPRRPYASDPPSPSHKAHYPDPSMPEKSTTHIGMNKDELKERRRKRQKYHFEKGSVDHARTLDEHLPLRPAKELPETSIRAVGHPLSLESLLENHRKATTFGDAKSAMTRLQADTESQARLLSFDSEVQHLANGHSNVFHIDHVESVSLQSSSSTSTLERQRSARKRLENEDRKSQSVEEKEVAPTIHYHLMIQNCDGMNIYVNNPSGDTFSPSAIQVDEEGLLKQLSWCQSSAAPKCSTSNGNYYQRATGTESSFLASVKTDDRHDNDKCLEKHIPKGRCADRACSKELVENTSTADSKSKEMADSTSTFSWHHNKDFRSGEVKPVHGQKTMPAATQTSPESVTSSARNNQNDQENTQRTNSSPCKKGDSHSRNLTAGGVRPVAHVSPRRRAEPTTHLQQTVQRSVAQQQPHQQQQQPHQYFTQSQNTVLNHDNLSTRDTTQWSQLETSRLTSFVGHLSGSISSLTTEALLEADANGDLSASDLDSTLNEESYSSSESAVSVVEVVSSYNIGRSRVEEYDQRLRLHSPEQQRRNGLIRSRLASSPERPSSYAQTAGTYSMSQNPSIRRIQSMREGRTADGGWTAPDRYGDISQELARVPGVLIVSNRRDRLMVYLSRDRPNVEGVVRFMVAHNVHQSLYDCQIMPYRIQNRPTITPGDLLVHSRGADFLLNAAEFADEIWRFAAGRVFGI
ncbi:hypothetical protein LSH36_756g02039 [Paralvinella palmiformis]|uniref:Uncharacterized protein n=1 Tax=Paralvinella palmiformis TaxID=53620 RepID=A0AAD9J1X2_9ANNE|nr:hypothetical protein LSH36_756g02039 [Paralvinella palmiformis]